MSPMRSKELAALAGISVRALRHYHQIGVLPEPGRDPNGYRRYGLPHAAQVLRIRHLASLGVPLDQMPRYLEDPHDEASIRLLDDLDRDLDARIAVLVAQRERIALLRADGRRPDLPRALDKLVDLVGPMGSAEFADFDRDAALVLAQVTSRADAAADLEGFGDALAALPPDEISRVVAAFEGLVDSATPDQVDAVVRAYTDLFGPAVRAFLETPSGVLLQRTAVGDLPAIHDDPRLNEAQSRALTSIGERLDDPRSR